MTRLLVCVSAPEEQAEWDRPVGVGTLIRVDTTMPVDIVKVAAEVRGQLEV